MSTGTFEPGSAPPAFDADRLVSARAAAIDVSGIRRVFELGARLENPINLSIGQPDFPVPPRIKEAAIEAVRADRNGYTLTQGAPELREAVSRRLLKDVGWRAPSDELGLLITSGTSGALMLACLAVLNRGDEIIVPDPYFVIYPTLGQIAGARIVYCDTYPDFRMTAARVEPLITGRTRIVLVNSPANPSGVVLGGGELEELAGLCRRRGVLLVSDEIYDEFSYREAREEGRCPSPARSSRDMLLVRGFGKTYGCTGWRLGYAAGPAVLTAAMARLQQYTFVCAPSIAQVAAAVAFEVDMREHVESYRRRRDMVVEALEEVARIDRPGGAFYAFVEVPARLGMSASEFVERAIERRVLIIPGTVFSRRDTHFRLSYAAPEEKLREGLAILRGMLKR